MPVTTVRYHVRPLIERDLVHRHRVGPTLVYVPDDVLGAWVEEVGEGVKRPWLG